jgi:hypothetical protein
MDYCIFCGELTGQDSIGDRRVTTCCELAVALSAKSETVIISHEDLCHISARLWKHDRFCKMIEDALQTQ